MSNTSETTTVRGACPQDRPDTCAFIYHVRDGRLVDVTGDRDHPMTRGGLCVKLSDFAGHRYHPDRLLHPMKRTGPKGSYNGRGSFGAIALVSEDVGAGLVVTSVGHWPGLNRTGTAVNSTTAQRHANLGQAGAYPDNVVQIEAVPASPAIAAE